VLDTFPAYHFDMADWLDGRVQEAEHGLAAVVADRQAAGETYFALWASHELGRVSAPVAGWGRPWEPTAGPWRWRPAGPAGGPGRRHGPGRRSRGGAAAEPPGRRLAPRQRGRRVAPAAPVSGPLAAGLAALAWIRQVRGDPAGTLEAIAQLVVTLDTVKKHLTHIFDKLGATNRTQALAHARQLGLIR
jgi:hypothetical protein